MLPECETGPPVSRRRVLGAALAVGAMVVTGQQRANAGPARAAVPETIVAGLRSTGGVHSVPFPVGHVGLTWSGGDGGAVRFRGTTGWGEWHPVPHSDPDSADGKRSALIPAGGSGGFELATPADAADVDVLLINTTDGRPTRSVFAPSASDLPMGPASTAVGLDSAYLSRAGWGADEALRFGLDGNELFPASFWDVQTLTVHHTATANRDPDPAATIRAIYAFHTLGRGWGDIGYHLLVDRDGVVYEGRWSGPDPVAVFEGRRSNGAPRMSLGAHVAGFNAGNLGIALLGDLTSTQPTAAGRRALVRVLAGLAGETRLNPLATTNYVNPSHGAALTVPTISGHRDWRSTGCPGGTFYSSLPDLRREVAAALAAPSPA